MCCAYMSSPACVEVSWVLRHELPLLNQPDMAAVHCFCRSISESLRSQHVDRRTTETEHRADRAYAREVIGLSCHDYGKMWHLSSIARCGCDRPQSSTPFSSDCKADSVRSSLWRCFDKRGTSARSQCSMLIAMPRALVTQTVPDLATHDV